MNNWHISGNLGADAEQRHTSSGESIVSCKVAVKSGYGDKQETLWPKLQIWGKRGESVLPYLKKGQRVEAFGELKLNNWQDKEGQPRTDLVLNVAQIELGPKKEDKPSEDAKPSKGKPSFDDLGNDIPF